MKSSKCISLFISIVFVSIHLSAQTISKVDENTYSYNWRIYEFENMEDVFIAKFDSYQEYQSALKLRTTTNVLGYTIIGFMALGTIAPSLNSESCDFICTGDLVAAFSWLIIVPVVGSIGIITRIAFNKKRKNAINLFNSSQAIGYINNSEQWNLNIGSGQYGYGIVLNF